MKWNVKELLNLRKQTIYVYLFIQLTVLLILRVAADNTQLNCAKEHESQMLNPEKKKSLNYIGFPFNLE